MPVAANSSALLPGLSPVCGKPIVARFNEAQMASDRGLLALREVEQRLGIARRLTSCIRDPRAPERISHGVDEITGFGMLRLPRATPD